SDVANDAGGDYTVVVGDLQNVERNRLWQALEPVTDPVPRLKERVLRKRLELLPQNVEIRDVLQGFEANHFAGPILRSNCRGHRPERRKALGLLTEPVPHTAPEGSESRTSV